MANDNDLNDSLSRVLNSLAGKGLSQAETSEQRANLVVLAKDFNGTSGPTVEKVIQSLSMVSDYGSRWIMAKMMRDAALKNPDVAATVADALYNHFAKTGDAGMRQMASGLLRDIGISNESVAVRAASSIALLLENEKDMPAKIAQKNALMTLAMTYEAAAPIAVCAIGQAMANEPTPGFRIQLSGDLREAGMKYASQSGAVIKRHSAAVLKEKDGLAGQHYAQNMSEVALRNRGIVTEAITALSEGFRISRDVVAVSGFARALTALGQQHPAAVINEMSTLIEDGLQKDHRRMLVIGLSDLAQLGGVPTSAAESVLLRALPQEPDAYNRRIIINGLMTAASHGNDDGERVKDALKRYLPQEKDPETLKLVDKSLRSLGYVRPFVSNVLSFQPGQA